MEADKVTATLEILQDASARIAMHGVSYAEVAQAHLEWGIAGLAKQLDYEQFLTVMSEAGSRFYAARLQADAASGVVQ